MRLATEDMRTTVAVVYLSEWYFANLINSQGLASRSDEAADRAAHTFERALSVAPWPRYQSTAAPWRIQVAPAEPMLAAA